MKGLYERVWVYGIMDMKCTAFVRVRVGRPMPRVCSPWSSLFGSLCWRFEILEAEGPEVGLR